jgi:hypothetical protein
VEREILCPDFGTARRCIEYKAQWIKKLNPEREKKQKITGSDL